MPERYADLVADFANRAPTATRAEWVAFAQEHARHVYQAGFQRGYEHSERLEVKPWDLTDPDAIADAYDPDWRNGSGIDLTGDPGYVPEPEREEMGDDEDGGRRRSRRPG